KKIIETRAIVRWSGRNVRRRLREEPCPKITRTDTIVEVLEVEAGPRQAKYSSEAVYLKLLFVFLSFQITYVQISLYDYSSIYFMISTCVNCLIFLPQHEPTSTAAAVDFDVE